jgi:hypothetical protein
MNNLKTIAFDVNGTLDSYPTFLLMVIDSLLEQGHTIIIWSMDKEMARQFCIDNFTPDQKIRFKKKVYKNEEEKPIVDIAIDDDPVSSKDLSASSVFLINSLPKDIDKFIDFILQ